MKNTFTQLTRNQLQTIKGGAEMFIQMQTAFATTTPPAEPPVEDDLNRGGGRP